MRTLNKNEKGHLYLKHVDPILLSFYGDDVKPTCDGFFQINKQARICGCALSGVETQAHRSRSSEGRSLESTGKKKKRN